jgi:hypothetical protein
LSKKFLRDQSETLPKTILFKKLPAIKKKKEKERGIVKPAKGRKKMKKRGFVLFFHGNCLKNQKQSIR